MDSYNDILKRYEDIALSDKEVLDLVDKKANLILYPQLHNYEMIDQILNPYGACIILYESQPNYGHWCCIFKIDDNTLEFFNPYGGYPDINLEQIPYNFRKESNQDYPHLSWLMYNSNYNLTYNQHKFQKYDQDVKTCGRWCALRLNCRSMPLEEFYKMIKQLTNKLHVTNDELVTMLTMFINK